MLDTVDYTEVPLLEEILNFLPINPEDEEDVVNYIQNITNLIAVNYKYSQYQFAYFGVHLLYMTYVYCTAWKIAQIEPDRYKDVIIFARAYNGREKDLKINEANSIFAYSLMPENDIAKIFKIIELDKSKIDDVSDIVKVRNEMAHASGKFGILTENSFNTKMNTILKSMESINKCMNKPIRKWFSQILLSFCIGKYDEYDNSKDFILEQMIPSFKLSINELIVCNEMSVSKLITEHRGYEAKLKEFKKVMKEYCQETGYI